MGKTGIVLILVVGIVFSMLQYGNKQVVKTTVTEKERIVTKNGDNLDSYYLIYTKDGTFKLEDDLFYGNFRSSDWYGNIRVDSTYEFTTVGFRIGITSSYPNIVKYQ